MSPAFGKAKLLSGQSAESQVREAVEKLAATVVEVAATRSDAIRRAEADIVRLSIEIARRILHRELSLDTSALEALIRAALEKLRVAGSLSRAGSPRSGTVGSRLPAADRPRTQTSRWSATPRNRAAAPSLRSAAALWTLPWRRSFAKSSTAWPTTWENRA